MALDSNLLFNDGTTAVTADGQSSGLSVGPGEHVIEVDVQAKSGTSPTMDITVQEYNGSAWVNLAVFPQITVTGQWHRKVYTQYDQLRLDYNAGGTTPSFTIVAGITRGVIEN